MSDGTNHVELRGQISVYKSYPERDGKKAFVIARIKVGETSFDLRAWEQAAYDLGNAKDLTATITGRLGKEKPRDWDKLSAEDRKKTQWAIVVVVERVVEHPPRGLNVDAPEARDEEIPF